MSIEHRVNKKTGKDEYCCRYRWRDETGKLRGSETGWFPTILLAQKNADELKNVKEADSSLKISNKRTAYIITVLKSIYLEELKEQAYRKTDDNTTTQTNWYRRAKPVVFYHTPDEIKYTKINEITPRTFRIWATHINDKQLAGSTVARYIEEIGRFNHWLADRGYYTDTNLELNVDLAIQRTTVKKRSVGARRDRYLLGTDDIAKVVRYYREKGLGVFKNFYFYTLFYVLFYTGMRPEEAIALQWKNVDLRPDERIIYIKNAISQEEKESNAISRTKKGLYHCKNFESERGIPIFDIIYQLLCDYKESYIYASGITNIDDCFVFPRELKYERFDWNMFDGKGYWLLEYKEALKACGLPNSDIQMLRHSCATFLVAPAPDGLGFDEAKVKDFFGHTTDTMLRTVYARLQAKQKTTRLKSTFEDYYSPTENKKDKEAYKAKEAILKRVSGDNKIQTNYARKTRIIGQITQCIANGQDKYEYAPIDEELISQIKDKFNIQFVLIKKNK